MSAECRAPSSALARAAAICLALSSSLGTSGCEWFTDFKRQPHVVTWESMRADSAVVRGSPQFSVPTTGTFMPGFAVSYSPLPGAIDSLASIPNPTPVSAPSLANGRKYYQINCAVCHGNTGVGDGAAVRYGMIGMPLMSDLMKNRPDGYIYGMIRNGRGLMPSYNRIEEMDRWDVVNYIRALQGTVSGLQFETGPLAAPGVNGEMVPGPTRLGPTRWVPHVGPGGAAGAAPGGPSADSTRREGRAGGRE